ncbi:MAG: hypothetical protein GXP25_02260 [Planctomycetes bacterium]|nr:hypothetical protein [Planctomycetota bacterium]
MHGGRSLSLAFMALLSLCGTLWAVDLSNLTKSATNWQGYHKGAFRLTVERAGLAGEPALQFAADATEKKTTYASITYTFPEPVDMTGIQGISFFAKTDAPGLVIKLGLGCPDGNLHWGFIGKPGKDQFRKCVFDLSKARKGDKLPDLSRVRTLALGFGIWALEKRKGAHTVIIDRISYKARSTAFVIPRPTKGVVIDGLFRDWGYEDTLYNWTPPMYIKLDRGEQALPKGERWGGKAALSGRCSMMLDSKSLYFLALVVDATPRQGTAAEAWKNDSLELFLSFDTEKLAHEKGRALGAGDVRIVFDCGRNGPKTTLFREGKRFGPSFPTKLVGNTWMLDGKQVKGYVLEAQIPLSILTARPLTMGDRIAYSIKLNDSQGVSLALTPKNLRPHAGLRRWQTAYVEREIEDENRKIEFGETAREVCWPEEYSRDEGRIPIWDMKIAHRERVSSTRERTYLHSLWAAQGVEAPGISPDPKKWFYAPCPMGIGWYTPGFALKQGSKDELGPNQNVLGLFKKKTTFVWYERTFEADPAWRKGTTCLVFDYVTGETQVYLNTKLIGVIDRRSDPIDITRFVKFGERNRLDLFVYNTGNYGIDVRNGSGISGDVYLEHHKAKPVISDIWVKKASGLDGTYEMVLETGGVPGEGADATFDILDKDNNVVSSARRRLDQASISVSGRCENFRPWTLDSPELYRVRVRVQRGGDILDEKLQRFGFRTFEIKNARFMLNGKILRLRMCHSVWESGVVEPDRFKQLKRSGYNAIFLHASHYGFLRPLLDTLDEVGMVTHPPTDKMQEDPMTVRDIKSYRNHPSAIMYVSDSFGQLSQNGYSHNPFAVSDTYYPSSKEALSTYSYLRKRYDLFQSVDPTRPYFPHATGNFEGSCRSTNHYPTYGCNMRDRAQFYEKWSKRENPLLPYHLIECGVSHIPYDVLHPTHRCNAGKWHNAPRTLEFEMASRYIGPRAFDDWEAWDVLMMRSMIRGLRTCGIDGFTPWSVPWMLGPASGFEKIREWKDNRRLSYKFFVRPYKDVLQDGWMRCNTWYYKLRGYALWQWPEYYGTGKVEERPSPHAQIYRKEMQPMFAYVGGPKRDCFSLEHNFFAGETIEKQIVAVNDTFDDLELSVLCTFTVDGKECSKKSVNMKLPQGAIVKRPVSFMAPGVERKTRGKVRIDYASEKGTPMADEFAVTIFPREPKPRIDLANVGVASVEANPLTKQLGIKCRDISLGGPLNGVDLLVIERNALAKNIAPEALERFINNGGNAIVFEQSDKGLMDWRMRERRLGTVFAADGRHPILEGLDDEDLSYWRGAADITPAEKPPSKFFRHALSVGIAIPFLTQEGTVATFVFQRPGYGRFRTILAGGYDLEEAALMEMRSGKGRLIWCQMDVSNRYGLDPAATRLVNNIFRYAAASPPEARARAAYIGGPGGRAFLDQLGIVCSGAKAAQDADVVVVGEAVPGQAARPFVDIPVKPEGTILYLPSARPAAALPKGVRIAEKPTPLMGLRRPGFHTGSPTSYGFRPFKGLHPAVEHLPDPQPALLRGLLDNDAFFFPGLKLKSVEVTKGASAKLDWKSERAMIVQVAVSGAKAVLCRFDPRDMEHGECRRKAWRIWSQIFTNLDVPNRFSLSFRPPALDISGPGWLFLTDPDDEGMKVGYQNGEFGKKKPRPISVGKPWEEQGVTEPNPNLYSPPDSAYDGLAWYFKTVRMPAKIRKGTLYFHIDGVRSIDSFGPAENGVDLWINGQKVGKLVECRNAKNGGRGARLWQVDRSHLKAGQENFIAIRVRNTRGPGGIHRRPVRFEVAGQNEGMLFPYEFIESKFNPYYHWAW